MKQVRELDYDRVESEHRALLQVRMNESSLVPLGAVRCSRGDSHWPKQWGCKTLFVLLVGYTVHVQKLSTGLYRSVHQMWSITVSLR
jgi:hypothetical protein